jgi:hypothetical protein
MMHGAFNALHLSCDGMQLILHLTCNAMHRLQHCASNILRHEMQTWQLHQKRCASNIARNISGQGTPADAAEPEGGSTGV